MDVFLDTNIVIYLVSGELAKQTRARELVLAGGVISVQVLNEAARSLRRKLLLPWPQTQAVLDFIKLNTQVDDVSLRTHEAALVIARRYGFQVFDSLLLASALEAGCSRFLSEDLQHGQVIEGRLTIENPFL